MSIRYRQIHLDFHASEAIPGIGTARDKKHWQEKLKRGQVPDVVFTSGAVPFPDGRLNVYYGGPTNAWCWPPRRWMNSSPAAAAEGK